MAEVGGEEERGEGAPDEVEEEGVLDVSPGDGVAAKDAAHAFENRRAWQCHGDGLEP